MRPKATSNAPEGDFKSSPASLGVQSTARRLNGTRTPGLSGSASCVRPKGDFKCARGRLQELACVTGCAVDGQTAKWDADSWVVRVGVMCAPEGRLQMLAALTLPTSMLRTYPRGGADRRVCSGPEWRWRRLYHQRKRQGAEPAREGLGIAEVEAARKSEVVAANVTRKNWHVGRVLSWHALKGVHVGLLPVRKRFHRIDEPRGRHIGKPRHQGVAQRCRVRPRCHVSRWTRQHVEGGSGMQGTGGGFAGAPWGGDAREPVLALAWINHVVGSVKGQDIRASPVGRRIRP